jgi:hypothetical protein
MKRREFLIGAGLAGVVAPRLGRSALPCPPPTVSVSGGSSATTACGPSQAPAWFTAMADKTWTQVAQGTAGSAAYQKGSSLTDVAPNPLPPGNEGQQAIIDDWTGACASQTLGEYYLPAQGGHDGYYGNEVYALALRTETPGWQRIWGPTPNAQIQQTGLGYNPVAFGNADGSPRTSHGWFNIFCDKNGRLWLTMVDANPGGEWGTNCYSIDRNNVAAGWMYHGRLYPTIPGGSPGSTFGWQAGAGAFDPSTNRIWKRADMYVGQGVVSIDCAKAVAAGAQSTSTGPQTPGCTFYDNNDVVGVSPAPSVITTGTAAPCWIQLTAGQIQVMDLTNPTNLFSAKSASGSGASFSDGDGAVWHPASNALLVGNISMGANIAKLHLTGNDPRTASYAWSTVTPAAGNAVTPTAQFGGQYNGHFSKWQIINDMGNGQSAIVVCAGLNSVYVYKLPLAGV